MRYSLRLMKGNLKPAARLAELLGWLVEENG